MEPEDQVLFVVRNVASFDIRSQIIQPSQSATLPTSIQACIIHRQMKPAPLQKLLILSQLQAN